MRRLLKFERQLRDQLKKLNDQLQDTQAELQLTPEHVLNVVQTGLQLAGQPPLLETTLTGLWPDPAAGAMSGIPVADADRQLGGVYRWLGAPTYPTDSPHRV